jgi:hypothetical protein
VRVEFNHKKIEAVAAMKDAYRQQKTKADAAAASAEAQASKL